VITIHQRHRQTDRQTTCDRNTALCTKVHRAVKSSIVSNQETAKRFWRVSYKWRRFQIVKRSHCLWIGESAKKNGRKNLLNWKFYKNREVICMVYALKWLEKRDWKERCQLSKRLWPSPELESLRAKLKKERSVRNWEVRLSEALSRWILESPVRGVYTI